MLFGLGVVEYGESALVYIDIIIMCCFEIAAHWLISVRIFS